MASAAALADQATSTADAIRTERNDILISINFLNVGIGDQSADASDGFASKWRRCCSSALAARSASRADRNSRPSRPSKVRSEEKKRYPRSSLATIPAVRLSISLM